MDGTARWHAGGLVAVLGLIGLFLAANAADAGINLFGWAVAAFAVFYVFALIKQGFDTLDRRSRGQAPSAAE
jgi:ABC-type arginine transport system permease subunit